MSDINLTAHDGVHSLFFACGALRVDTTVEELGHTPNGYFWEGVVAYLDPELAAELELDCDAGMFNAFGTPAQLNKLRTLLQPCVGDPARIAAVIGDADAAGFEFDD